MGIFKKIEKLRRYSAFATGDFERIFEDLEVPPCPEVVTTLMRELDNPDIEIGEIVRILESDAALSARIIATANSALYGLASQVSSISKAVSLLGLKEIGNIALGYALVKASRDPDRDLFDMRAYWSDTLMRAIFARALSAKSHLGEPEEAFAGALFQDIAMPVIMGQWFDVYARVFNSWIRQGGVLSRHEEEILSWTHAQAGAWIAGKWEMPDILICAIGLHESPVEDIGRLGLDESSLLPVRLSSLLPSALMAYGRREIGGAKMQAGDDEAAQADTALLVSEAQEMGIYRKALAELVASSADLVEDLALALGVKTAGTGLYRATAELVEAA